MNNKRRGWLIGALFVAGALTMALALLKSFRSETQSELDLVVAEVKPEAGQVTKFRPGFVNPVRLSGSGSQIKNLESIETGPQGLALIHINGGYEIRLHESTLVSFELKDSASGPQKSVRNQLPLGPKGLAVNLILHRGDLRVEKIGPGKNLLISKNKSQILADDFLTSELMQSPTQWTEAARLLSDRISPSGPLSEAEIANVVESFKSLFLKCYGPLVERSRGEAIGQASLKFVIHKNGEASSISVGTSNLKKTDRDFERCVIDVASRMRFRSFEGIPVFAEIPLEFR